MEKDVLEVTRERGDIKSKRLEMERGQREIENEKENKKVLKEKEEEIEECLLILFAH